MFARNLLALLPLLATTTLAAPSTVARDAGSVRIKPDAQPGSCLSVSTARAPQDGDSIRLTSCDGAPHYQESLSFVIGEDKGEGKSIRYVDEWCFHTEGGNGSKVGLGDCSQDWTINSDGLIHGPDGQCFNIAKEDGSLQTWECNAEDAQFSKLAPPRG